MEIEGNVSMANGASGEARQAASAVDSPRRHVHPRERVHQPVYICPECREVCDSAEKLGPHLERHRPVQAPRYTERGRALTVFCQKGCRRSFAKNDSYERFRHEKLCDGSVPLAPIPPLLTVIHDRAFVRGGVIPPESHRSLGQSSEKTEGNGRAQGAKERGSRSGVAGPVGPTERRTGRSLRAEVLPAYTPTKEQPGWRSVRELKRRLEETK